MMITQKELKRMLERMEPWKDPEYRRIGRKCVRFVDWKRRARAVRS